VEENGQVVPPTAPNGVFAVTVDEKGRLKLPASMLAYLEGFGEERKVFITTFDELEARIYPISVWRETAKRLQEPSEENFEILEDLAKVAAHYGKDVDVDAQGRLTLPDTLRKTMSLEKDEARLSCFQNRITVWNSAEYEKQLAAARNNLPEKAKLAKRKGL
jgi:MraZ protein